MRFLFNSLICSLFLIPALCSASDVSSSVTKKQQADGVAQVVVAGKDQPVTVEKGEALILQATDNIILKPGTRVLAGGSLQARIVKTDIKALKKKEKERPLEMTQQEEAKITEHNSLEVAATLISPFVTKKTDLFRNGSNDEESFNLPSTSSSGIPVESQRRIATTFLTSLTTCNLKPETFFSPACATPSSSGPAFRVLRL